MLKGLNNFFRRNILPEPVYNDIATGIFGNTRRKPKIRRGLTKRQLQLLGLNERALPLTKEEKLKRVQGDIDAVLDRISYHEKAMKACGDDLAELIQTQKTLETTR